MIRILDRQRYWAFGKAYVICFVALVGLYIVIHAFSNIDEFSEVSSGIGDMLKNMGWYYLPRLSQFYDRLFGVIAMMAAVFTITWMQKDNQLLAMMAAGISAKRAIRPVIISTIIVTMLGIANQELLLPNYRFQLEIEPDNRNLKDVPVLHHFDINGISITGKRGNRQRKSIVMEATLPIELAGSLSSLTSQDAIYIPPDRLKDPSSYAGGWLLRGVQITPLLPDDAKIPFVSLKKSDLAGLPESIVPDEQLGGEDEQILFFRTNVSFEMLTRNKHWHNFAPTWELVEAMGDVSNSPEYNTIAIFVHTRILRPLSTLTLLLLSLPFVLGGYERNMFYNLGMALGTAASFYAANFVISYLGENEMIRPPELAAWMPVFLFGALAASRWDRIRT